MRSPQKKHQIVLLIGLFMLLFTFSCKKEEIEKIDAVEHRDSIPGLSAKKITTVISDSGITRYRIVTEKMEVFDRAKEPHWYFPKGLYFERFAPDLSIDANFECNEATYFELEKMWEFKGKVKAVNLQGNMFETEQLFWNERTKKIYSDHFIRITQPTRVTTGVGFDSDETMTRWSIRHPKSDMYVKEEQ